MGKREGKRPLGKPSHRWEDNVKKTFEDGRTASLLLGSWTSKR